MFSNLSTIWDLMDSHFKDDPVLCSQHHHWILPGLQLSGEDFVRLYLKCNNNMEKLSTYVVSVVHRSLSIHPVLLTVLMSLYSYQRISDMTDEVVVLYGCVTV
jgi:hypothetical protein